MKSLFLLYMIVQLVCRAMAMLRQLPQASPSPTRWPLVNLMGREMDRSLTSHSMDKESQSGVVMGAGRPTNPTNPTQISTYNSVWFGSLVRFG